MVNPDGYLLAVKIEVKEEDREVSGKTKIEGIFEGVDEETGAWIISGTLVFVGPGTDTDGLPYVGQRVKVVALSQEDGSLLAREIENKGGPRGPEEDSNEVEVEGIFQGVDEEDGSWIVDGVKVSVDSNTKLKGTPAIGSQIEIEAALLEDGSLLAKEIKAQRASAKKSRKDAEIEGTIDDIVVDEDGTRILVINGLSVKLSELTELEGDVEAGAYVEVEALFQEDGSLVAREVEVQEQDAVSEDGQRNEVEIEGTIESSSEDGTTLVVNGIKVSISGLSEVKGNLVEGAFVKIEGVLLSDGSIPAGELKGSGRRTTASGTEVEVEGLLDEINLDEDGNIVSVVVDGLTIDVEALTELEGTLEVGREVEIEGIIGDDGFLASKIEGDGDNGDDDGKTYELKIEGVIEALQVDAQGQVIGVTVNGVEVEIGAQTDVEGTLEAGATVEIKSFISDGAVVARKVEVEELEQEEAERTEFDMEGILEAVELDEDGNIVGIVVDGLTITVEPLTRVKGSLEPGSTIKVSGTVVDETLLARKIEGDKKKDKNEAVSRDQDEDDLAVEPQDDEPQDDEPQDEEGQDDESQGEKPQDDESQDDESQDDESQDDESQDEDDLVVSQTKEIRISGRVESVRRDGDGEPVRITVDGFNVNITGRTDIDGEVVGGARVKIKATINDGVITATEVDVKGSSNGKDKDEKNGNGNEDASSIDQEAEEDDESEGDSESGSIGDGNLDQATALQ